MERLKHLRQEERNTKRPPPPPSRFSPFQIFILLPFLANNPIILHFINLILITKIYFAFGRQVLYIISPLIFCLQVGSLVLKHLPPWNWCLWSPQLGPNFWGATRISWATYLLYLDYCCSLDAESPMDNANPSSKDTRRRPPAAYLRGAPKQIFGKSWEFGPSGLFSLISLIYFCTICTILKI